MLLFAGIAGSVSLVIGWLVTHRLFRLARDSGGAPERLLAIAFGGLFCIAYPLAAASRAPALGETHEGSLLFALAMIGMITGLGALCRFPYIVFRPDADWARLLAIGTTLLGGSSGLGAVGAVAQASTREETIRAIQPWALVLVGSIGIAMLWNAIESTLYYRNMKKRIGLGLADAATTHRFLLWAIAGWASTGQILVILAMRGSGMAILSPLPMSVIAVAALAGSLAWGLAFFMPESYRGWLERRALRRVRADA